jgi:hypothetical protein
MAFMRLRRGRDHFDPAGGEDRVERGRELGVPVPDQVGEPVSGFSQVGGELAGQLGGPGRARELGDAQQVHVPRVVLDDERYIQPGQRSCAVDVEEVHRQDRRGLCAQEGAPAIVSRCRGWYPVGAQDLADGARADPVAEATQLALDPDHAPAGVVPGQLDDQLG